MFEGYLFDVEKLVKEIRDRDWEKIVLQAPEGLLPGAIELALYFEEQNIDASVLMNPCYGACDLSPTPEGFHGVVHLGHAPMPGQNAVFVELASRANNIIALEKLVLPKNIGLAATVQHLHLIPDAKRILESRGMRVFIGKTDETSRVSHHGQVLGCDMSTARSIAGDVEAYVVLASGVFHGRGVAAATSKTVHVLDPHTGSVEKVDGERILRQRHGLIESARNARRFAVAASLKPGQNRLLLAEKLVMELKKSGREAVLVLADSLNPDSFRGLGVDAIVSTACPRIALDDYANYPVPVLSPSDVLVLLGLVRWENYLLDEMLFNRDIF